MKALLEAVSKQQEGGVACAYPAQAEGQIAPEQRASHIDPSTSSGSSPGSLEKPPMTSGRRFIAAQPGGDPRLSRARRVPAQSRFPSVGYLTYLVRNLGYDGNAARAAMVQAHQPWSRSVDRRRANSIDVDAVVTKFGIGREFASHSEPETPKFKWRTHSPLVSVARPYIPAASACRTTRGGGLSKEQVQRALAKKRWGDQMKKAVFEIVYGRRSSLEVSNESGIAVETLYVYASRLRQEIQNADLRPQRKAA